MQQLLEILWLNPTWLLPYGGPWLVPFWEGLLALAVLGLIYSGLYLLQRKLAVIALTTTRDCLTHPLFYLLCLIGGALLVLFCVLPYNTFGEDMRLLKDSALSLIMVFGIIMGLWTAGTSVSEEIEGQTAITLLSKPVTRVQFILGKFFGIVLPIGLVFVVLGIIFLLLIPARMNMRMDQNMDAILPTDYLFEMTQILPGLMLAFFEAVVLTAISVAISTRLPMLANMLLCAAIYALGHLAPMLVEYGGQQYVLVSFVGQLLAVLLPNLESFNIQAAVATGSEVPVAYLGWAFLYCVLYTTAVMFLALIMFDGRDLA